MVKLLCRGTNEGEGRAVDTFVLYSLLLLVQTHGIIFVADASDPSRFGEARSLLDQVLSDDRLKEKPLLM